MFSKVKRDLQWETVGSKLLFFACHEFKTSHTYSIANLNTLFDEIKDTENVDPKMKDLLQGLIENTKDDIIVGLQTRAHFLEN